MRQIEFLLRQLPNLLIGFPGNRPGGLLLSVILAAVGIAVGMVVAVVIGSAQLSSIGLVRRSARLYVQIIRGIPLLVLLLLVHQVLGRGPLPGLETTAFRSALVTLVLYSSAYQADIVRAGLRAVPPQLAEEARLLGSSPFTVYRTVKLPYALRVMQPALTGQGITVFKDSSVVVVLGVAELTTTARIALGGEVGNAPFWVATYLTVGGLYLIVALGLSRLAEHSERRLRRSNLVQSWTRFG